MMSQRVFMIALMASLCVAFPSTDLVVPEAQYAGNSGAEFVQSTLKSGGTEAQCRTFATDTIASTNAAVTSEQGILAAVDTGSGCAQEGQSGVATATTNKATADADVVTKTQAVTDATATQATACNAPVTMVVNLPTLTATSCYDYSQQAGFQTAQGACDAANTALSQANSALGVAQTAAADAQTALDAAVAEAARLMSECHCRVQTQRAAAWTAAGTATASHAAEWKQAHEILCALDQTSTCTVPSCPAVTQPAAASGVDAEDCSQHGQHCLRITTGTNSNNDGDVTVEVTAGALTTTAGNFARGATVVQHCYSVAPSLQVNDHSNDAWTGSFEYSSDGGSTYSAMTCTNCGVGTSAAMVVFDGNTDGSDQASTQCLNGATCAIQVVERDVRAAGGDAVAAGVAFVPEVMYNGQWSPICGHYFWDNDNGAATVCETLGFSGGTHAKTRTTYSTDAMPVGMCSAGQALTSCTGGGNAWGNFEYSSGWCKAGTAVGVTVTCA